jgi:hypothetical protein
LNVGVGLHCANCHKLVYYVDRDGNRVKTRDLGHPESRYWHEVLSRVYCGPICSMVDGENIKLEAFNKNAIDEAAARI